MAESVKQRMARQSKEELEYAAKIPKMTNNELIYDWSYYHAGDDYDGCRTSFGEIRYKLLTNELSNRLLDCKFLDEPLKTY
jgi:hypothetical protein